MNGFKELVLGIVAPVGTPIDETVESATRHFEQYGMSTEIIQVPSLSGEHNTNVLDRQELDLRSARMTRLREQVSDNNLFSDDKDFHSNAIYAYLTIERIGELRKQYLNDRDCKGVVYILDTLKHPDEVRLLKQVYEKCFYSLGITSSILSRVKNKLREVGGEERKDALIEAAEDVYDDYFPADTAHKNDVGKAYQLSDFFLNDNVEDMGSEVGRFIDLVFGAPNLTPRPSEHSMFMAYMSSLRSGDLSRQVGSTIVNHQHDILAVGVNEVPEARGGQYWAEANYIAFTKENVSTIKERNDQRDYALGYDVNAKLKGEILEEIIDVAFGSENISEEKKSELLEKLRKTSVGDITEFGRVVHAEMSALMSAARNGVSVNNMHMFCTTYPCHNCAKHIIAAGIMEVTYIEPYPKSKALFSHRDAIIDPEGLSLELAADNFDSRKQNIQKLVEAFKASAPDNQSEQKRNDKHKVVFRPFSGVGPSKYLDLFSMNLGVGEALVRKNKDGEAQFIDYGKVSGPRIASSHKQNAFSEQQYIESCAVDNEGFLNKLRHISARFESSFDGKQLEQSYIKYWNSEEKFGYIKSNLEKDYIFIGDNLKDGYTPKKGDDVQFVLKSKNGRQYAAEIGMAESQGADNSGSSAGSSNTLLASTVPKFEINYYNIHDEYGYVKVLHSDEKDFRFAREQLVNADNYAPDELRGLPVEVAGEGNARKIYIMN